MSGTPIRILLPEEDDDDSMLTTQALMENHLANGMHRVQDGAELLAYLKKQGANALPESAPPSSLFLLDLNLPRKDGRETSREINGDSRFRRPSVVVLTASCVHEDIVRSCDLGVNSFISKPVSVHGLDEAFNVVGRYWFEVVELPQEERNGSRKVT